MLFLKDLLYLLILSLCVDAITVFPDFLLSFSFFISNDIFPFYDFFSSLVLIIALITFVLSFSILPFGNGAHSPCTYLRRRVASFLSFFCGHSFSTSSFRYLHFYLSLISFRSFEKFLYSEFTHVFLFNLHAIITRFTQRFSSNFVFAAFSKKQFFLENSLYFWLFSTWSGKINSLWQFLWFFQ